MHIAIIGAGFCGLACAWHLAQNGDHQIALFDAREIGQGASGVAAGLLHPYAGARANKSWRADEGMQATLKLLQIAEKAAKKKIYKSQGLLRIAVTHSQEVDFYRCADLHSDVHGRTANACQSAVDGLAPYPGIFIDTAITVDCLQYLQGLWSACAAVGLTFEQRSIKSISELNAFDRIVITMGASSNVFPELAQIKITPVKGQVLELEWPEKLSPLPYPIASNAYLLMDPNKRSCITGATYERDFVNDQPDLNKAIAEIMPKVQTLFPMLDQSLVVGCRSGIRASTAGHRPLIKNIGNRLHVLTGMGSKGLLYHALFAEQLAKEMLS